MIRFLFLLLPILLLTACVTTGSNVPQASYILVSKSQKQMTLYDAEGTPMRQYDIQLGGDPTGPKQCEGDEKTPEGLYTIETRNENSKFHRSLKISYPNEADKLQAQAMGVSPGGDIFIHGAPNNKWLLESYMYKFKPGWTDGCIAVTNSEIEEIWASVADGTPIEITP